MKNGEKMTKASRCQRGPHCRNHPSMEKLQWSVSQGQVAPVCV